MDVERTIEFILEAQAKAETRMDGITKLLQQGMQLLVNFQTETNHKFNALVDAQLRTEARLDQLAEAQKITEEKLQRFLDRQSPNGH